MVPNSLVATLVVLLSIQVVIDGFYELISIQHSPCLLSDIDTPNLTINILSWLSDIHTPSFTLNIPSCTLITTGVV